MVGESHADLARDGHGDEQTRHERYPSMTFSLTRSTAITPSRPALRQGAGSTEVQPGRPLIALQHHRLAIVVGFAVRSLRRRDDGEALDSAIGRLGDIP